MQAALAKVTQEVWEATNQRQRPWVSDTLAQPVYLAKPAILIAAAKPVTSTKTASVKIGSAPTQTNSAGGTANSGHADADRCLA